MSRISRYQDSMNKFIKNKSCVTTLDGNMRIIFNNLYGTFDNMIPIILLTIMNSQSKKNKMSLHGYYIGCGVELLMTIARLNDNKKYHMNQLGEVSYNKLMKKIPCLANICLSQNIEHIQSAVSKDKAIKMFHYLTKTLNNKIYELLDDDVVEREGSIKKSDVVKYKFKNITNPKDYLNKIKKTSKQALIEYINKNFGVVCYIAMITGWIMGGGGTDEKSLSIIEKMGNYLGTMIKISYDFVNLERDLFM